MSFIVHSVEDLVSPITNLVGLTGGSSPKPAAIPAAAAPPTPLQLRRKAAAATFAARKKMLGAREQTDLSGPSGAVLGGKKSELGGL